MANNNANACADGTSGDLARNAITIVCFGLLPIILTVAEKGAVSILVVLGATGLAGAACSGGVRRLCPRGSLIFLVLTLAWAGYRSVDTFDGAPTTEKVLQIAGLVILAFGASWLVRSRTTGTRERALDVFALGAVGSLVLVLFAWLIVATGNAQIIGTNRADVLSLFSSGLVAITILSPLVVSHLARRRKLRLAALYPAVVLVTAVLSSSNAAIVAALAMIIAGVAMCRYPKAVTTLVCVGCVAGTLLLPGVIGTAIRVLDDGSRPQIDETRLTDPDGFAGSLGHRYYIWKFTLEKAAERPLLGWGFNSSRHIPGGHETIAIGKELMPLHPHNATLQLWLELGIPGLLIAAGSFWLLFRLRLGRDESPLGFTVLPLTLLGTFIAWNTTYGVWQSWWFSVLALIVVSLFLSANDTPDQDATGNET
jgi:O-antigen ligase